MKITQRKLKRIIREERDKLLNEAGYGFTYGRQAGGVFYAEGDIIEQRSNSGKKRYVRVEEKTSNVKNNRPGFDGVEVVNSNGQWVPADRHDRQSGVWGYDDQVLSVVEAV
jgi:hypothetical protein